MDDEPASFSVITGRDAKRRDPVIQVSMCRFQANLDGRIFVRP
jgi:hypothetical protein